MVDEHFEDHLALNTPQHNNRLSSSGCLNVHVVVEVSFSIIRERTEGHVNVPPCHSHR